jgi:hypothetical protein
MKLETFILRDSPDATWRLLELALRAGPHVRGPRERPPEIIIGEAFEAGTLAAARALAGAYEVIPFAESLGDTPRFHPAPDISPRGDLLSRGGSNHLRTFHVVDQVRWSARARRTIAYVRQFGRFPQDERFWAERISDPASILPSAGENHIAYACIQQRTLKPSNKPSSNFTACLGKARPPVETKILSKCP